MLLGPSIFSCFPDVKTRKSSVNYSVSCCFILQRAWANLQLLFTATQRPGIEIAPGCGSDKVMKDTGESQGILYNLYRYPLITSYFHPIIILPSQRGCPGTTVFCLFFQSYGYNPCILAHPEMVLMPTIFWWFSSYETPAKCNSRWLFQFECGIPYTVYYYIPKYVAIELLGKYLWHNDVFFIINKLRIFHGFPNIFPAFSKKLQKRLA